MDLKRIVFLSLALINFCAHSMDSRNVVLAIQNGGGNLGRTLVEENTWSAKKIGAKVVAAAALVGPTLYNCYQANANGGDMSAALKTGLLVGLVASSNVVLVADVWLLGKDERSLGDKSACACLGCSVLGGLLWTYCLYAGKFGFQRSTNKLLTFMPAAVGTIIPFAMWKLAK